MTEKRGRGRPRKKTAAELFDEQMDEDDLAPAAERLHEIVSRIEEIEEEISGLRADRSDVYAEAKAGGFEISIVRMIVRRRRMDKASREEADALLKMYEDALEGGDA